VFSQGSASEATLVCLLAAKDRTVKRIKALNPNMDDGDIKAKLVAYTSGDISETTGLRASRVRPRCSKRVGVITRSELCSVFGS